MTHARIADTTSAPFGRVVPKQGLDGGTRLLFPSLRRFYRAMDQVAYACLRAAFGIILVTHGLPKLTGGAHGQMADPSAGAIRFIRDVLHLPYAAWFGTFVTGLEAFGGAMLVVGVGTRLVAPAVAIEMAAICYVLGPTWVWLDRGLEYPFLMGVLAFYVAMRGGGPYSVDRLLGREL